MLKSLVRGIGTLAVVLVGQAALAQGQRFVLDMNDLRLQGPGQIIRLKQEIMQRYNVRLDDERLIGIRLVAKSEFGRGTARVLTQDGATTAVNISGRPQDFFNSAPYTFDRIDIDTRYLNSRRSFWQLETNGNLIIRRIVVEVDRGHIGPQPGPGQGQTMDIHRFFTGGAHFWSLNLQEGINAGFRYEGVAFRTLVQGQPGTHQIFRCYNGATHFISRDMYCEGGRQEGGMGFVFSQRNPQARTEIIRCRKDIGGRFIHLVTGDARECYNNGYMVEGPLGWVR